MRETPMSQFILAVERLRAVAKMHSIAGTAIMSITVDRHIYEHLNWHLAANLCYGDLYVSREWIEGGPVIRICGIKIECGE